MRELNVRNNLTVCLDNEILGWVSITGCENRHCLIGVMDGRPWHAAPKVGALRDHHFASFAEAVAALLA